MNGGVSIFREEATYINKTFPGLSLIEKAGEPIVVGEHALIDSNEVFHTTYSIEIHAVPEYPFRFPLVFETAGRIPRNIDWHVFEVDGHCCLKNQPEEILICKGGINLVSFIEKEVTPYFFNQLYREKHGYFLRERSHGVLGQLEFFFDVFGTTDIRKVHQLMTFVNQRVEPGRTEKCFCNSGEKYRRCHREAYRKVVQFSERELSYFIHQLIESKGS